MTSRTPALIALLGALSATGCAASTAAITTASTSASNALTQAQTALSTAVNFYGTAKGLAQIAALADPSLAPSINAAIAVLDPIASAAQTALNSASTDVASLTALANQITTQASQLQVIAAPAIKVVSNKT